MKISLGSRVCCHAQQTARQLNCNADMYALESRVTRSIYGRAAHFDIPKWRDPPQPQLPHRISAQAAAYAPRPSRSILFNHSCARYASTHPPPGHRQCAPWLAANFSASVRRSLGDVEVGVRGCHGSTLSSSTGAQLGWWPLRCFARSGSFHRQSVLTYSAASSPGFHVFRVGAPPNSCHPFPLFPVFLVLNIYGNDEGNASIEVRPGNPEHWESTVDETGNTGNILVSHRLPIPPFEPVTLAFPVPHPTLGPKASGGANLISLRPLRLWLVDAFLQDFRNCCGWRLSNSESSMIQTPRVCVAASLLPRSASSSVKYSPATVRNAVYFRMPCGPSRIRQQSAFAPRVGRFARRPR